MKCQMCGKGTLKKGKIKETMFGVYLGEFPAEVCTKCNESFTDEKTTKAIEEAARKEGNDAYMHPDKNRIIIESH